MIVETIRRLVEGRDLSGEECAAAMDEIMAGKATPAQVAAWITALRVKGETVEEIAACARVMRSRAVQVQAPSGDVIDTCGTGGDGARTFNISTTAALVVAGAGVAVAKHGNRSVSSACGSADLLAALGVRIDAPLVVVERCLREAGIGFLFAPLLHGAMKHAVGPRREIGIRTVFNILGPLTNPAGARRQLLGVYEGGLTEPLCRVLDDLGSIRALVVHGHDGLDELTLTGPTRVSELDRGRIRTYDVDPTDLGLARCTAEELRGGDAQENARITLEILKGAVGPRRDVTLLNAAAALYVAGKVGTLEQGLVLAAESVDSGAALAKLESLRSLSREEGPEKGFVRRDPG